MLLRLLFLLSVVFAERLHFVGFPLSPDAQCATLVLLLFTPNFDSTTMHPRSIQCQEGSIFRSIEEHGYGASKSEANITQNNHKEEARGSRRRLTTLLLARIGWTGAESHYST